MTWSEQTLDILAVIADQRVRVMRRDNCLNVIGNKLDHDLVELIQGHFIVLTNCRFQWGDVFNNIAALLTTSALSIDPEPNNFGVVFGQLLYVGVLGRIGQSLQIVQVCASPRW